MNSKMDDGVSLQQKCGFCVLKALIKNYSVISEFLIKHKHELRTRTNKCYTK